MRRFPLRRLSAAGLVMIGLVWFAGCAYAQQADEVDYLELAARLIADGNYDRAETALRNVDLEAEGVDFARYYTLDGLIALRSERPAEAIEAFDKALAAYDRRAETEPEPSEEIAEERIRARQRVHLYLAQAHMGENHYRQALVNLDEAGEVGDAIAMVHALRAQAHWELNEYEAAIAALDRGAERFPADYRFLRRKVFYLINLGFYQHAAELGRQYLTVAAPEPEDFVAIGSALRKSGQHQAALTILERARLSYPRDRDIAVELAHTWMDLDKVGAAAEVLAGAAVFNPQMRFEAAELQRRAGRQFRALLLNSAITDQQRKYRQRLAILVAMERWDRAAAMREALERNGLMASDDIRYALAYAYFKAGDYEAAERALGGIEDVDLFLKATELRRVMEQCRDARWQCM